MIASMFKDDNENVPPNVANADNVTADEVVDQISFTMKLNVKKFLAGQQIPNYEIAKAEAEKIKRINNYNAGANVTPAWAEQLGIQSTALGNQFTALGNQFTALGNQFTALGNQFTEIKTVIKRSRNAHAANIGYFNLSPLRCEVVGHGNFNTLPSNEIFPENITVAQSWTLHSSINDLQEFYGEQFEGATVALKTKSFLNFIGYYD